MSRLTACGFEHSALIDNSGGLWVTGSNLYGQLGIKEQKDPSKLDLIWLEGESQRQQRRSSTKQINSLRKVQIYNEIVSVSCGIYFTVCVDTNGDVWSFGRNENGQLGVGHVNMQIHPTHVRCLQNILLVECGSYHTVCIDGNSELWSFGSNSHGQLGLGRSCHLVETPTKVDSISDIMEVSCGLHHTICSNYSGELFAFGSNSRGELALPDTENRNVPTKITKLQNIVQFKCGDSSSEFLNDKGQVFRSCLAMHEPGLEQIKELPEIKMISGGYVHMMYVDIEGFLWVWGGNSFYQLGVPYGGFISKPTKNSDFHNVCELSSGGNHSIIKDSAGLVWVFGSNSMGQLGINHYNSPVLPTQYPADLLEGFGRNPKLLKSALK